MHKMTANQAKQNFGELLDKAQAEPVEITRHGRRVGVLVSDEWFAFDQFKKRRDFEAKLKLSREQIRNGEGIPAEEVYASLREKMNVWALEAKNKNTS